ncbi:MAG: hypothetical protein JXB45_08110 [Candidatus Krumholzibacteriota bacterium]|nr:hypothetical protein [Candidatus Krumholzibacteriota bacterium]
MKRRLSLLIALLICLSGITPRLLRAGKPKYDFKFSGFFKTDLIYDLSRISPGNYALYVDSKGRDDNAFYLNTRETRLGFDFGWTEEEIKTSAKLEFDFYGIGAEGENKAGPMLRHAYLMISRGPWSLLAGQTWDVISPLNPSTANYSVLWDQGNIGYRRPQVRFSLQGDINEESRVLLAVALSRTIGIDIDSDGVDDGVDSGQPTVQGRVGIQSKLGEGSDLACGVSGHFGQEKWNPDDSRTTDSWSLNTDLTLKVNSRLCLKGEFFTGKNLGSYLGGIGQSITPRHEALPALGGWGMVAVKPHDRITCNAGYSFDDPDDSKYNVPDNNTPYTLKDMNSEIFANIFVDITGNVTGIFEVAYLQTDYLTKTQSGSTITLSPLERDSFRFQLALKAAIK